MHSKPTLVWLFLENGPDMDSSCPNFLKFMHKISPFCMRVRKIVHLSWIVKSREKELTRVGIYHNEVLILETITFGSMQSKKGLTKIYSTLIHKESLIMYLA